jgi:hypothetical protein
LANTTYDSREAIIIYKDKKDLVRDTLTVTQAQLNAVVLVDKSLSIGSVGGTVEAKVKSNVSYEVVMPDADWISRVPKTRGLTESVEQFTVKPNSGHDGRSAKIIFKTSDNKSDTLVVTQSQLDAIILTNKNVAIEPNGATIDVKVMSNVNYEVKIPSDVDWVKVAPKTRGLAESTVQLVVSENKTYDNRSANIIFKSGDNVKDTLSITQAQLNAIIISNKNVNVESGGGTIDVKVKSNVDYSVEIPSSVNWIKVAPKSRALTESTVQFIVDENSGDDSRSAEILLKSRTGLIDTLNVVQYSDVVVIHTESVGTFEQKYLDLGQPEKIKVIGPIRGDELVISIKYYCRYCDLSEAVFYNDDGERKNSMPYTGNRIRTLIMPKYMTSIESKAFASSPYLTYIVLPNSLYNIGYRAFYDCSNLKEISIPSSVKRLDDCVFQRCVSLESISIPNSVTEIGTWLFDDCYKLKSVTLPDNLDSIPDAMFSETPISSLVIPDRVRKIGRYAFQECLNLRSVDFLPSNLEEIGYFAFYNCSNLSNVSLPGSLTTIGYCAFSGCNIDSISIPSSVVYIDDYAFTNVNTAYVYAKTPPRRSQDYEDEIKPIIVKDLAKSKLYVPKGCLKIYKEKWGHMFGNIYEMNE